MEHVKSFFVWMWIAAFGAFFGGPFCALAQCEKADSSKKHFYKILPAAYYLPETKFAFGGVLFASIKSKSDSNQKVGNLQHYISITQRGQFLLENSWQIFAKRNMLLFMGSLDLSRFPEIFFGIGQSKMPCSPVFYQADQFRFSNRTLWELFPHTYAGTNVRIESLFNFRPYSQMSAEKLQMTQGGNGFLSFGGGPALVFDSRDFPLNPTKGIFIELINTWFQYVGNKPFVLLSFDFRNFIPLKSERTILAFQSVYKSSFGDVPFRLLPALGGASLNRGYYFGRYRDRKMWIVQSEIRQKLSGRFGLVAFSGVGNVGEENRDLADHIHFHYGAGIRFKVHKCDRVNVRLDWAKSGNNIQFYLVLAEAF